MLNQLYSSVSSQSNANIEELLQEDQNVKRRREKFQKQSSILSKLTRQLSIHDNRATTASWSDSISAVESPRTPKLQSSSDDWISSFDSAANGSTSLSNPNPSNKSSSANGRSHRYEPTQNGDVGGYGSNSSSRRTPNRMPPPPPQCSSNSSSIYRY